MYIAYVCYGTAWNTNVDPETHNHYNALVLRTGQSGAQPIRCDVNVCDVV